MGHDRLAELDLRVGLEDVAHLIIDPRTFDNQSRCGLALSAILSELIHLVRPAWSESQVEFLAVKLWFGAEGAENVLSILEIGGIMPLLIANNFSRLAYSITKGKLPDHDIVKVLSLWMLTGPACWISILKQAVFMWFFDHFLLIG